jgi:glycosyltransferase involved in cell wall biosynthesis
MRILFDARSVRTPSGRYVFQGLTRAWVADPRVERVVAAVARSFDRSNVPAGVEPIVIERGNWLTHVSHEIPRLADLVDADVIFAPNGMAPRDRRSVAYFQDLFHFKAQAAHSGDIRASIVRRVRATWRAVAAPRWMLAVPVSQEIAAEVEARVASPSVLIPNGVDVGEWRWTGENDSVFVMGGIGGRKDEATAMRAWARISPAVRGETVLRIGGVEPASRRVALQLLAESLSIAGNVSIFGSMQREAYLSNIAQSRLAVSCSTFEAFGLPVAEALALGAPVLASAIPAHVECLARADAGMAFAVRGVEELGRMMEDALYRSGPKRLQQPPADWTWSSRGRQHVDAYARYL